MLAPAEASANLARYDGIRYGPRARGVDMIDSVKQTRALFGPEVKRRIMLGTYALSAGYHDAYYGRASKVRTLIKKDFLAGVCARWTSSPARPARRQPSALASALLIP